MQYFTLASFVALVSLATADDGPGPTFTISPYGQGDTVCKASALLDPPGQFIVGPGDVGTSRQLPLDTVSSYLTSVTFIGLTNNSFFFTSYTVRRWLLLRPQLVACLQD